MCDIWENNINDIWLAAEKHYDALVLPENLNLEKELSTLSVSNIKAMNTEEFYDFLHDKYFVWKFTTKNRLASTRKHLECYKNDLEELSLIKQALISFDPSNTQLGLKIAMLIKGLGCAGASGLLSILFPLYFGTVDQFVVERLQEFSAFKNNSFIQDIKPENIKLNQAIILVEILKDKAKEMNSLNNTNYWTPRKIDMVLWSLNR